MRPITAKIALSIAAVTLLCAAGATSAEVPEPQTYWTGQMHSEVPATLAGRAVIHAQELAGILSEGKAILIDAAAAPRRPENLASGAIWKPVPHEDIAGSIWIAGNRFWKAHARRRSLLPDTSQGA